MSQTRLYAILVQCVPTLLRKAEHTHDIYSSTLPSFSSFLPSSQSTQQLLPSQKTLLMYSGAVESFLGVSLSFPPSLSLHLYYQCIGVLPVMLEVMDPF